MSIDGSPEFLDALLKAAIIEYLKGYEVDIADNYEESQQAFLDLFIPMWEAQKKLNEAVEMYYYGSIGNRSAMNASQFATNMMSILVPVFMRPRRFIQEMPEEAKDQLANQHVTHNLSERTGSPLPLLLPTNFDEFGAVVEIFDMIVSGPDGEPFLTQWATPAIMALQDEGMNLPEELAQLIALPDSFA